LINEEGQNDQTRRGGDKFIAYSTLRVVVLICFDKRGRPKWEGGGEVTAHSIDVSLMDSPNVECVVCWYATLDTSNYCEVCVSVCEF